MPLHVTKHERFPHADRNELALAALEYCRAVSESEGVGRSRFYWIDPNEIAVLIEAEQGAWGAWSTHQPSRREAVAMFALADLARNTVNEVWGDAKAGQATFDLANP
jgi:hypothetical protein